MASPQWAAASHGVLRLPSGRLVRGRSLRVPSSVDDLDPGFGLYLVAGPARVTPWPSRWLQWPDFRLPIDRSDARDAFEEAWRRCAFERVEVACAGGLGRTGTALACIAVLDGVPAWSAATFVKQNYHLRAVETPWQRRYIRSFMV